MSNDMEEYAEDAWHKHMTVVNDNLREWRPRQDLLVEALGTERTVRFTLFETDPLHPHRPRIYHSTTRNTMTFQELAWAMLDACDFVNEVNPAWGKDHYSIRDEILKVLKDKKWRGKSFEPEELADAIAEAIHFDPEPLPALHITDPGD